MKFRFKAFYRRRGGLAQHRRLGERSLRRLLILGASSAAKAAARDNSRANPWLASMLARKPRMLVNF